MSTMEFIYLSKYIDKSLEKDFHDSINRFGDEVLPRAIICIHAIHQLFSKTSHHPTIKVIYSPSKLIHNPYFKANYEILKRGNEKELRAIIDKNIEYLFSYYLIRAYVEFKRDVKKIIRITYGFEYITIYEEDEFFQEKFSYIPFVDSYGIIHIEGYITTILVSIIKQIKKLGA